MLLLVLVMCRHILKRCFGLTWRSACENLAWLTETLDCYQEYLKNVRGQVCS